MSFNNICRFPIMYFIVVSPATWLQKLPWIQNLSNTAQQHENLIRFYIKEKRVIGLGL